MIILVPTMLEAAAAFPEIGRDPASAPVLFLARTSLGEPAWLARCGFGLSASGARAAAAWARLPGDACLAGIAGTLDESRAPVGSVILASAVEVEGIGFGTEEDFVHPASAGGALQAEWSLQEPSLPWLPPLGALRAPLLSVASASGSARHAELRRSRHPECVAEEMEAHAVLNAASALRRKLCVIRGISNVAGDRDRSRWRVAEALAAVRVTLDAWLLP